MDGFEDWIPPTGSVDGVIWKPVKEARKIRRATGDEGDAEALMNAPTATRRRPSPAAMSIIGMSMMLGLFVLTLGMIAAIVVGAIALSRVNDQISATTTRLCDVSCPLNKQLTITNSRTGFGIVAGFNHTFSDAGTLPGSAIMSGDSNTVITSVTSVVAGGLLNSITSSAGSFIGGGISNVINGNESNSILGGFNNTLVGNTAVIVGGVNNILTIDGESSFIGAGGHHIMAGFSSAIVAGDANAISNTVFAAFIAAGRRNVIAGDGDQGFIGGGNDHVLTGTRGAIVSGDNNNVSGTRSLIGAGQNNAILGSDAFIGAGSNNTLGATAVCASVIAGKDLAIDGANEADTAHASNLHTLGSFRTSAVRNVTAATYSIAQGDYLITTDGAGVTIEFPTGAPDGMHVQIRLNSADDIVLDPTGAGTELCGIGAACTSASGSITADFGGGHFVYDASANRWWEVV